MKMATGLVHRLMLQFYAAFPEDPPPTTADAPSVAVLHGNGEVSPQKPRIVCAPGRANVIGEHTDYQEGFVMPFALADHRCYVVYRPRPDRTTVRAFAADLDQWGEADLASMAEKRRADPAWGSRKDDFEVPFLRYVAGPFEWTRTEIIDVGGDSSGDAAATAYRGCDVLLTSTVPSGGGVSSSSAIVVACTVAARDAYREYPLVKTADGVDDDALLRTACEAEWHYSGVRGGIMDQFASLEARPGKAMVIDCRTRRVACEVEFPADEVRFLVINTNVKHSLADSPYAKRREACERVAALAGVPMLRDLSDLGDAAALQKLDELEGRIDPVDKRRAIHGVLENNRVRRAVELAKQRDWPAFGRLLDEAHASLRDLYDVSCPELDAACQAAREADACYGARMMGGGFGGCAIALCRVGDVDVVAEHVAKRYKELTGGLEATIFAARPGAGAQLLVDDATTTTNGVAGSSKTTTNGRTTTNGTTTTTTNGEAAVKTNGDLWVAALDVPRLWK